MDGLRPGCPPDATLEAYLYEDLPYLQNARVRVHLAFCKSCRKRLLDLRNFSAMLSQIPIEEPPDGFVDDILSSMERWGDPTPVAVADEEDQVPVCGPSAKVRWALGTLLFVASSFVQWQYGDYLPAISQAVTSPVLRALARCGSSSALELGGRRLSRSFRRSGPTDWGPWKSWGLQYQRSSLA